LDESAVFEIPGECDPDQVATPLRHHPHAPRSRDSVRAPVSSYREFAPQHAMVAVLACTWEARPGWPDQPTGKDTRTTAVLSPRMLPVLPDGCLDLTWDGRHLRAAAATAGPTRHPIDTPADTVGLRLQPGWAAAVLGVPAHHLPPVLELSQLWSTPTVRQLEERLSHAATNPQRRDLLTELTAHRLTKHHRVDRQVLAAISHIARGHVSVHATAEAVGLSVRQLRRRFDEHVGLSPKTLHIILRFQHFLRAAQDPNQRRNLADIATTYGYSDQSHLTRECRRLANSTPRSLAIRAPQIESRTRDRPKSRTRP